MAQFVGPGLRASVRAITHPSWVSATTIILAAGPTAVGLGALGFRSWEQRRGFKHERAMTDLGDLRALLDDAAVALHDANYSRRGIEVERMSEGTKLAERAAEQIARLGEIGKELDRLGERLAVRLGPDDDAVTQFRAADEAVQEVLHAARTPERFAELDVRAWHNEFEAANTSFNDARAAFLEAAAERAGAKLP